MTFNPSALVDDTNPFPVSATINATIGDWAVANAADPANGEGSAAPGSVDLSGYQRVRAKQNLSNPSQLTEAKIDIGASGTTAIVSATTAQTSRLYRLLLVAAAPVNVTIKDGSTALTGAIALAAGVPFILPLDGEPWFTTSANSALNLTTDGNVQVSGRVYYVKS